MPAGDNPITSVIIAAMNKMTTVAELATPVDAIRAAIAQFPTQGRFRKALMDFSKRPISNAAISQWVIRGQGASAAYCPDIEAISGVPCEALRPETNWAHLRGTTKPPAYKPRLPPPQPQNAAS